jgi:hypothetical protein
MHNFKLVDNLLYDPIVAPWMPPKKGGYCAYTSDTLDPFLAHFRYYYPFDEIKILFPKPGEQQKY